MTGTPSVRPLNARDLDALLPLHREAFDGYIHTRLGARYLRVFLRWFVTNSAALAFGAFGADGVLIGYVFGAPPWALLQLQRNLYGVRIVGLLSHPRLIGERGVRQAIWTWIDGRHAARSSDGSSADVHLVGIGVGTQARGLGIGDELISTFEAEARRRGYLSAFLAVHPTNAPARRLYERMGWTLSPAGAAGLTLGYQRNLARSDDGRTVDPPGPPG